MDDKDRLILIRDTINSESGRQVLSYATEFMLDVASRPGSNAEWVKGMGMLISHLKEVDMACKNKFERNN